MTQQQYRQGDVYLIRVDDLPKDVQPVAKEKGRIVLAHGEATGHAHTITNRVAKFFEDRAGERYLTLPTPAVLEHQEHDPIDLPPGTYKVTRQKEYAPEEIRRVAD